jgi:hypothetical protein
VGVSVDDSDDEVQITVFADGSVIDVITMPGVATPTTSIGRGVSPFDSDQVAGVTQMTSQPNPVTPITPQVNPTVTTGTVEKSASSIFLPGALVCLLPALLMLAR